MGSMQHQKRRFRGAIGAILISSVFSGLWAQPKLVVQVVVDQMRAETQEQRGNATVITAMVPLANMFGYINSLRSMSQGRAQYSMFFDHYSKVPQNVQDEVTKKIAG